MLRSAREGEERFARVPLSDLASAEAAETKVEWKQKTVARADPTGLRATSLSQSRMDRTPRAELQLPAFEIEKASVYIPPSTKPTSLHPPPQIRPPTPPILQAILPPIQPSHPPRHSLHNPPLRSFRSIPAQFPKHGSTHPIHSHKFRFSHRAVEGVVADELAFRWVVGA